MPETMPGTMGDLLDYLARELVDDPDAVRVEQIDDERGVLLTLRVAQDDMGKVIGRGGRTARAIRIVMKAAGMRAGIHHTSVEIVEVGEHSVDQPDAIPAGWVQTGPLAVMPNAALPFTTLSTVLMSA